MKKIFFYIAALSLMAAACNKAELNPAEGGEESTPAAKMIIETVSATTEMSTKATIADEGGTFSWTKNDNIAVHVSNGTTHKYVLTSETGGKGASVSAGTASFTIAYDEGYARDAFAVYPSTIVSPSATNYGQSGATLDVTLPDSYTLAQVSGDITPCPMIATNTPESGWEFKQLCGLLRLTVNSIPPSTQRLEIDFNGKKVCGAFSIAKNVSPGTSVIVTSDDTANDCITITKDGTSDETLYSGWGDGKVFNIPLPTGTYGDITITAYDARTGGETILTMTRSLKNGVATYTASRQGGVKRTASFPVFSINGAYDDYPPVSSQTRRVIFSPGNLQAATVNKGTTWTWSFAAHQYDFIGSSAVANNKINGTGTVSDNGTVDLFGRSVEGNSYGISNSTSKGDYNGTFKDWGKIRTFSYRGVTTTYPEDYWFTLTGENDLKNAANQWSRIMNYRQTGATVNSVTNARYALAMINVSSTDANDGVMGIILFPDYYSGPSATTTDIKWGTINAHGYVSNWGGTRCTVAGWEALESEGCVFLPAAGRRYSVSGSAYGYSYYAANNLVSDYAWYTLHFKSSTDKYNIYWNDACNAWLGAAVRLVHEIE